MCRSKGVLRRFLRIACRIRESFCVMFPLEKSPFLLHQDEWNSYHGDDDDQSSSIHIPSDVPEDHLAIYSGNRRFVVRIKDLNHPLFRVLLDKAEEEFGFEQRGVLVIPCDPKVVQHLLSLLQTKAPPQSLSFYGESSDKRLRWWSVFEF
ncbi:hypothetical protein SUGI_0200710 [Cryptomeria japonica]|nr:hypothetical protein SUGI_0200710 [Cryptomeria japonica]